MKNPPRCPDCNKELVKVNATGKTVWIYDQGHYDSQGNLDSTLSCPNCNACLDGVFGEKIYYWGLE